MDKSTVATLNSAVLQDTSQLTQRELDVLACFYRGRSYKAIAFLLQISAKTVETHTRAILIKLSCHSREDVIRYIERHNGAQALNGHYDLLCQKNSHDKILHEISSGVKSPFEEWVIVLDDSLKDRLKPLKPKFRHLPYTIKFMTSNETLDVKENHLYLIPENASSKTLPSHQTRVVLDHADDTTVLIDILKFFSPNLNDLEARARLDHIRLDLTENEPSNISTSHRNPMNVKNIFSPILVFIALFFVLSCVFILMFSGDISPQNDTRIRSELMVPKVGELLPRTDMITQMSQLLKGGNGIETLALTGIGGSGKTTLARMFARTHSSMLVWEINAETRVSLLSSFERLAYALAKSQSDQRHLLELTTLENEQEKEEKVLLFVKEHLKTQKKWLLIFDNVEQFSDIKSHIPTDAGVWGQGIVIITSRDGNFDNNSHINHCLVVHELTPVEKKELFLKIKNVDPPELTKTEAFLKEIPPYPLDLATTAHYLKDTGATYHEYVKRMKENSAEFEMSKENLLKEMGHYTKTRFGIITLSVQKILEKNTQFIPLILLISLINAEDISKDFLASFAGDLVSEDFIHALRHHSLITSENNTTKTFSIHRSTQAIFLSYLLDASKISLHKVFLKRIAQTLLDYLIALNINGEFLSASRIKHNERLIHHAETFLTHILNILPQESAKIKGEIGYAYCLFSAWEKAQSLLETALTELEQKSNHVLDSLDRARILSHLGILYWDIGKHDDSRKVLEESIRIFKRNGNFVDATFAKSLVYLGIGYGEIERYDEAIHLLQSSLNLYKQYYDNMPLSRAFALIFLGKIYLCSGHLKEAKFFTKESIKLFQKHNVTHNRQYHVALSYLGYVYEALGEFEKALEVKKIVHSFYTKWYSPQSTFVAWSLRNLGIAHHHVGLLDLAQSYLEKSLAIYQGAFGDQNIKTQWVMLALGKVYRDKGDLNRAKIIFEDSLKIFSTSNLWLDRILRNLAKLYILEGNLEHAEKILNDAINMSKNISNKNYRCYELMGRLYLEKASRAQERNLMLKHDVYLKKAQLYFEQSLVCAKDSLPPNCSRFKNILIQKQNIDKKRPRLNQDSNPG